MPRQTSTQTCCWHSASRRLGPSAVQQWTSLGGLGQASTRWPVHALCPLGISQAGAQQRYENDLTEHGNSRRALTSHLTLSLQMMLMGHEPTLAALRSDLEASCGDGACVTRAMARMLEVLPYGSSKASGATHDPPPSPCPLSPFRCMPSMHRPNYISSLPLFPLSRVFLTHSLSRTIEFPFG